LHQMEGYKFNGAPEIYSRPTPVAVAVFEQKIVSSSAM